MYKWFFCCVLLIISFTISAQEKKQITLDDIWKNNTFRQEYVAGFRSMNDGNHYSERDEQGQLVQKRFSDSKLVKVIADLKNIKFENSNLQIDDYEFNLDETKLLLFTESENIYRRSILCKVFVYDIKSKGITIVHDKKILHASFSPQSDKVAFVYDNNMYYKNLNNNKTIQITHTGSYNIINGNCDWVYEEEFEFTKAYEWSAKGDYIAYYKFNQTLVPEYNFAKYDELYPTDYRYKYPKAGEMNSEIEIFTYHLTKTITNKCDLGTEKDIYIPRIKINANSNSLMIYRLNRLQNHLEILEANALTGKTNIVYEEKNKYFIEINDNIHFLNKRNAFVYTSEKDGFNHIYIHDISSNQSIQLTKGNWEVTEIKGVDEKKNKVYYMSAESSSMERQLYSIGTDGKNKTIITPEEGWHDIEFSENFNFYLDKYSKANQVPTYKLFESNGSNRTLKDNQRLTDKMNEFDLSELELIQVPNEEGTLLNAWIIKPSSFNASKKYPLLMFQYSGPGSQQVMNQFGNRDFWWYQMLAQKGYIIACVDGTGTGFRGEEFKKKTYLQLGKLESDDQIAAAKYFANQSYIDPSRIGIWGWSYGGFMSSICILKGADVFKTAIAVAPVTNWRYYDNIYTERYMRTPQENAKGYDDNSPVNMVEKLKGNYLLIHGTADDNVHFQNSVMMIDGLIKANKDFDSELYPNKAHGISGGITRLQLYHRLTNFILEKL